MIHPEVELDDWATLGPRIANQVPALRPTLEALKPLNRLKVACVKLPYGARIIDEGRFNWNLLGEHRDWKDAYGTVRVPLALVLGGAVELFDVQSYIERVWKEQKKITRHVPMFLLRAGDFFGLFENFAPHFSQPSLYADAGGTTLIVLPPIGDKEKVAKLRGQKDNDGPKFKFLDSDVEHLRVVRGSDLSFGPFFASLMRDFGCPWRMEIAVFPQEFVDGLKRMPVAHRAILLATVDQLSIAGVRNEQAAAIFRNASSTEKRHVLAVRMIAHGLRPGFAPVLQDEMDEVVLPAKCIDRLMRDHGLFDAGSLPSMLRPAFPSELSFYFLKRPYFDAHEDETRGKTDQKIGEIVRKAGNPRDLIGRIEEVGSSDRMRLIIEHERRASALVAESQIKICESAFVSGGVVAIKPEAHRDR